MPTRPADAWDSGEEYEPYVGRWSRLVADEFVRWLGVPPGGRWLDVGCGTGALTEAILASAAPLSVRGVDPSQGFVAYARRRLRDDRAAFDTAGAEALPDADETYDAVVAGLVLNFLSQPQRALPEFLRVARRGATVGVYVWDYAGQMQMLRAFWDAAAALDPAASALDEGRRFPDCNPDALTSLFRDASLETVDVRAIDMPTEFGSFDDFWRPFLGGQGPAPSYLASLDHEARTRLRDRLEAALPFAADGSIHLLARAWAVRGRRP